MILLSPSQIATWTECKRKWAWRYIAKIQTESHPSARLGSEVHDEQLKPYLKEGRAFDYSRESGYIAASGLEHLPPPQAPGLHVEEHFSFHRTDGAYGYQGYRDFWTEDSGIIPGCAGGVPGLGDHKTTSDLRWAKTPEVLETDTQAIVYAHDLLNRTGAPAVDLAWIYYQTKKPYKSKPVRLRLVREHVSHQFEQVDLVAQEIAATRAQAPNPLELPPTTSACSAYGGCPYRNLCNLSPLEFIRADIVQERKREMTMDLLNKLLPGTSVQPPAEGLPGWADPAKPDPLTGREASPINPPEGAAPQGVPAEEAPKKRGRPKKEKPAEPEAVQAPPSFKLYIDCIPFGNVQATAAEKLYALAQEKIKAETGAQDYRLVEFGKGAGLLSQLVLALAKSGEYGDVILDSRTPEGGVCMSALMAHASFIVKGMR